VSRRMAREVALQVLFQITEGANSPLMALEEAWSRNCSGNLDPEIPSQPLEDGDRAFIQKLVESILDEQARIDQQITSLSRGWPLERIGTVERAILRLAFGELLLAEVPPSIVANEAVELAKRYGDDDSRRFINGIVGSAIRERED
jgi:N utilization substance protein B